MPENIFVSVFVCNMLQRVVIHITAEFSLCIHCGKEASFQTVSSTTETTSMCTIIHRNQIILCMQ